MSTPFIAIDLEKIEQNARTITTLCAQHGIDVAGVTKVSCGDPRVAEAMLRGGATMLAETRLDNLRRLKAAGVSAPCMLLRLPHLSEAHEIVAAFDISLNSERRVIQALSQAAQAQGRVHDIILMVDLGDLREGVWPDDVIPLAQDVVRLPGARLVGLGTNLSCYGGVVPTEKNMTRLVNYASELERCCNVRLQYISGGNSSALNLLASGKMPTAINHLRIGEAILLGRETVKRMAWPDTWQDAFTLCAEVIELKKKPSKPIGETSGDAFGFTPIFEDKGDIFRAILNLGRQDVSIDGLIPEDSRLIMLGASSDHLILDVTAANDDIRVVRRRVAFSLRYAALLAAMTSPYVEKRYERHSSRVAND